MEIYGYSISLTSKSPPALSQERESGRRVVSQTSHSLNPTDSIVSQSRDVIVRDAVAKTEASYTRLLADRIETTNQGIRKTQTFETADGRSFTRIEDIVVTDKGARRTVIQQNVSGSITRLEDILERQDNGSFRRTQRFTDESGETLVTIQNEFISTNPFILSGGKVAETSSLKLTPLPLRGTQLDLTA